MTSPAARIPVVNKQPNVLQSNFVEEPLGLPASEGFGYFQGGPGLSMGPNNRFKLQAKLGKGRASSVWLAHDCINNTYVTIKILSGYYTYLNHEGNLRELEVLQRLSLEAPKGSANRCPRLLLPFIHPGIEEDGDHLCLAMELFWSNVHDSRALLDDDIYLPIPVVKQMLRHVLQGLARLHSLGIAHESYRKLLTDIKPDNIMIDLGSRWTTGAINKWLSENPPSTYPPEQSLTKMVSVFRSQSFPPPTVDELSSCSFKLADFSSAQFVNDKTTDNITPLGLRPPEVILGGDWNESVDIWTLGCIAFTLLTGRPLFKPMTFEKNNASEIDVSLYQMISYCGEFFQPDLLQRCSRSREYFNLDCKHKKFEKYGRTTFDECVLSTASGYALSPADLAGVTNFMTQCLRLDPKNRATVQELLQHPWLVQYIRQSDLPSSSLTVLTAETDKISVLCTMTAT